MKAAARMYDAGKGAMHARLMRGACAAAFIVLGFGTTAASIDIPPAATRKAVELDQGRAEAARLFRARCGACHRKPDPARAKATISACTDGLSAGEMDVVRNYLTDVQAGKLLYASLCGRCHDLIDPRAHTAEYWSHNLCTSEECFIKNPTPEQEQQLLLFLTSQAKRK